MSKEKQKKGSGDTKSIRNITNTDRHAIARTRRIKRNESRIEIARQGTLGEVIARHEVRVAVADPSVEMYNAAWQI